jgi:hypothetical protein
VGLVTFALAVILGILAQLQAGASEVDERAARIVVLEREAARLQVERRTLATVHEERAAGISALKAQPPSWARDRKLGAALADSKDMAARLDRKDNEVRANAAALLGARRSLLAAIDRELAAQPAPPAARAEALAHRRGALVAALRARPLRVPDWGIEPDDDAQDLVYKAAALEQSERALRVEEARLQARVTHFRRQAKLVKSRARADEQDIFDEEPRHGAARPAARGGDSADTSSHAPPSPAGPASEGDGPAPIGTGFGGQGADLAADPSIILAEVVAAGTLDELRRAERSGDPESMARAAERASKEVEARAARLRALRLEMERRAERLRTQGP